MKSGWKEGEENVNAKVPFEAIEKARAEWESRATLKSLARKYGVPYETMRSWVYYQNRVNK